MNRSILITVLLCLLLSAANTFPQQDINKTRIGVFDSRCLAVAYGRSADFLEGIDSIRSELDKAKEQGNEELVRELEQLGPTKQVLLHQQVFSNASINNILGKIKNRTTALAKENNVKMILSKWEIPFADESIEFVDITEQLVTIFNPDEQTRKIIDNIKAMEPVPIEKISVNPVE